MNQWLRYLASALLCALLVVGADRHVSLAESQGGAFDKRFVSSWLGVVDGEVKTRTLTIKALHPGPANTLEADAGYGATGSDPLPVRCTISVGTGGTKLTLVSIYGERIDADEHSDGWFIGTYTYKNGRTTSITLGRIWDEDLHKNKYSMTGDGQITLVYFGAEDCAYSNWWEKNDQPVFLLSKERSHVDFRIIKRKVHNRSPEFDDFPDDLKWIFDQAEAGGVSPYFVVAVDETVVLKTYGYHNWDGEVVPLLKDLCTRKKIARSPRLAE
jgi:hypothetical protein